jgi:hypothetical protein
MGSTNNQRQQLKLQHPQMNLSTAFPSSFRVQSPFLPGN